MEKQALIKKGDKVKNRYGKILEVREVRGNDVYTYERQGSTHITKLFKL